MLATAAPVEVAAAAAVEVADPLFEVLDETAC